MKVAEVGLRINRSPALEHLVANKGVSLPDRDGERSRALSRLMPRRCHRRGRGIYGQSAWFRRSRGWAALVERIVNPADKLRG